MDMRHGRRAPHNTLSLAVREVIIIFIILCYLCHVVIANMSPLLKHYYEKVLYLCHFSI